MIAVQTLTRQNDLPWQREQTRRRRRQCVVTARHCDSDANPKAAAQLGRRTERMRLQVASSGHTRYPGAEPLAGPVTHPMAGSSSGGSSPAVRPAHAACEVAG
jgi:hypothetical protein